MTPSAHPSSAGQHDDVFLTVPLQPVVECLGPVKGKHGAHVTHVTCSPGGICGELAKPLRLACVQPEDLNAILVVATLDQGPHVLSCWFSGWIDQVTILAVRLDGHVGAFAVLAHVSGDPAVVDEHVVRA